MAKVSALEQSVTRAMALHQSGNVAAARTAYEVILRQHPKEPNTLMNLSTLLTVQGELEEAARLLKKLINLHPKLPQPHYGYGNLMMRLGRKEDALASFDRSLTLNPQAADVHYNRGIVLDGLKRFAEALTSFDRVLQIDPNHARAYCNRIATLNYLGRYEEALAASRHPFANDTPDQGWLFLTRAIALQELRRTDEALAHYGKALEFGSHQAEIYSHRANAYNEQGRHVEALADIDRSIALNDGHSAFVQNVRGSALNRLGRFAEAAQHYEQALALDDALESAYWNLAVVKLVLGDYAGGLPLYEWRWNVGPQKGSARVTDIPLWLGEASLEGKSILVHPEQGLGDFIQCARYTALLVARGAKVVLETPAALYALFAENFNGPDVTVVEAGAAVPRTDFHCPIMSLPLALGLTLETLPNDVPYLRADAAKIAAWDVRLGAKTQRRVGLVWSGRPQHVYDHQRSIPLSMLQPLLQQNAAFYSLQKEVRAGDREALSMLQDHARELQDFSDTAALVSLMDLVVTVDTSVAHLAGAMGKNVWLMLPFVPDYRWLLAREDTPLYPTMRLFRQPVDADWASVIARITTAFEEMV